MTMVSRYLSVPTPPGGWARWSHSRPARRRQDKSCPLRGSSLGTRRIWIRTCRGILHDGTRKGLASRIMLQTVLGIPSMLWRCPTTGLPRSPLLVQSVQVPGELAELPRQTQWQQLPRQAPHSLEMTAEILAPLISRSHNIEYHPGRASTMARTSVDAASGGQ
jgi:hypothetical protein